MRELYKIIRTDTADALLHKIIMYIAGNFGNRAALERLNQLETDILRLADNPCIGMDPKYMVLRRQGYKVMILEKDLVFYKINEAEKVVTIYAIVDQRQDYLSIIRGL